MIDDLVVYRPWNSGLGAADWTRTDLDEFLADHRSSPPARIFTVDTEPGGQALKAGDRLLRKTTNVRTTPPASSLPHTDSAGLVSAPGVRPGRAPLPRCNFGPAQISVALDELLVDARWNIRPADGLKIECALCAIWLSLLGAVRPRLNPRTHTTGPGSAAASWSRLRSRPPARARLVYDQAYALVANDERSRTARRPASSSSAACADLAEGELLDDARRERRVVKRLEVQQRRRALGRAR